jgi:hypothetical protein
MRAEKRQAAISLEIIRWAPFLLLLYEMSGLMAYEESTRG